MDKALEWAEIDAVLLDMDGVLLDLRYDNWFWREHVPSRYADRHEIPLEEAKSRVFPKMHSVQGTIDWYCVDYWSETLELDIVELKSNSAHRVSIRPQVIEFLLSVRDLADGVHLVTNAHRKTVEVKFAQTGLGRYFDEIISSHDYGVPKEDVAFWNEMFRNRALDPARALFIDDNLEVLRSAKAFGIGHLRTVVQPDSGQPGRIDGEFRAIHSFSEIMP